MAKEFFSGAPLGQVGGDRPELIPDIAYAKGINVTRRTGGIETRPGIRELSLTFETDRDEERFTKGKFQGAFQYFSSETGFAACVFDGHLFLIDPETGEVYNMSREAGPSSDIVDRCYFAQAGRFLIVQDGINQPIIVDGTSARRSDPALNEVPVGTFMVYGQNRLFLATNTPDKNDFIAGNIGTPLDPDAVLRFTETGYPALGGGFELPAAYGPITGMGMIPTLDASTGVGPLVVGTPGGMFAYNVLLPRAEWETQLIGSAIAIGEGFTSAQSIVNIDNDLFFRSLDRVTSIALGRTDFNSHANVTVSAEVRDELSYDTKWLLKFSSGCYWNGWMFMTNKADRVILEGDQPRYDVTHRGLLVMDFTGADKAVEPGKPVWEGTWTHVPVLQVMTIQSRGLQKMLIFSKDRTKTNRLYEQTADQVYDTTNTGPWGTMFPISSRVYTKSYGFNNAFETKNIGKVKVWLSNIAGNFCFEANYRADEYPQWNPFGKVHKGKSTVSGCHSCTSGPLQKQSRSHLNLGGGSSIEKKVGDAGVLSSGESFQPRFDWTGHLSLDKFHLEAETASRSGSAMTCGSEKNSELAFCPVDDYELVTERSETCVS